MAEGISIHVVDVSRGVVAAWMRVELYALQPARRLVYLPMKLTPWGLACFRGGV